MEAVIEKSNLNIKKNNSGKIRIKAEDKSRIYVKLVLISLVALTVLAFLTFDYKGIDFWSATAETLKNIRVMFLEASPSHFTIGAGISQIGITLALAFLTTIIGAVVALFLSLFSATNLSTKTSSNIIKGIVAFIRAIPTVLWVLIFAVTLGLSSGAAIVGMTFHTIGYLVKAYSEAFEELDNGVLEALRASGANWWQVVFQAVLPSSVRYIFAWTFMRFEINFTTAVAMGAAAGAGGIGFELFMSSSFYYNVREVGFITIGILIVAVMLEIMSTKIKRKYI